MRFITSPIKTGATSVWKREEEEKKDEKDFAEREK